MRNQHGRCYKSQWSDGTNPERARKAIATSQAAADMPVVTCSMWCHHTQPPAGRRVRLARLKMNYARMEFEGWRVQDASPAVCPHFGNNRIEGLILGAGGDILMGQAGQKP